MTLQTSWRDGQLEREAVLSGLAALGKELEMEISVRFTEPRRRQRMGVLVTREPHCLETLLAQLKARKLPKAELGMILSNRRDLEPVARAHRIPFVRIPWEQRLK